MCIRSARLVVLSLATACVLAACGETTVVVRTVTAPPATTEREEPVQTAPPEETARIGDRLTLEGQETTIAVEATEVIDPVPVGEFDAPQGDERFVGVRLRIENVGDVAFGDAVANGAKLVTTDDEQADATLVSGGPCSGGFSSDVKVAPGDRRAGCVAFAVPGDAELRTFQFTPDSGFAGDTGEWEIDRTTATAAEGARSGARSGADDDGGTPSSTTAIEACDENISVRADTTTCEFAQNAFYEYFVSGGAQRIDVYSPATGTTFTTECSAVAGTITCLTDDGGEVRFPQSAVDAYSPGQAEAYAESHEVAP